LRWAAEFNFLIWDASVIAAPRVFKADRFALKDRHSDTGIDFFMDRPFTVVQYPIYTVNETEAGLGKTFQGISILIGDEGLFKNARTREEMGITIAIG